MKTKTFLITVITLFLLVGVNGCDKNNDDNEICEFNVDDPINDLEWLKNKIPTTTSPDYSIYYDLYQNKKSSQKYFFLEGHINNVITEYSREIIYNCNGDTIMMKGIEGPKPEGWDKYFEENEKIKRIWPVE